MIHLFPSLSLEGRFTAQDLPNELQLPLLNNRVVPRIVSSSMTPTIHEGDRLKLNPPTSLTIGTIVVFRHDTLLICHRITAIDSQGTLWTRGDATLGSCEIIQPDSVIGVVTGVIRKGAHLSLGKQPDVPPVAANLSSLMSRIWTVAVRSVAQSVCVLTRFSLFQSALAALVRWTATVDVLTPTPLQSLSSLSKITSFTLRMFPLMPGLLAASIDQKQTRFVIRLGPWQLAQYDPTTETLLLRQPLQDAGLESFIRQICCQR